MRSLEKYWDSVSKDLEAFYGKGHPSKWKKIQISLFLEDLFFKIIEICKSDNNKARKIGIPFVKGKFHFEGFYPLSYDTFRRIFITQESNGRPSLREIFSIYLGYESFQDYILKKDIKKDGSKPIINTESTTLKIPKEFIFGIYQYLIFFREFVESAKGVDFDFQIFRNNEGLKIELKYDDINSKENIKKWFSEYVNFAKGESVEDINFEKDVSNEEMEVLKFRVEQQVSQLNTELAIKKLQLEERKEEIKLLREKIKEYRNDKNRLLGIVEDAVKNMNLLDSSEFGENREVKIKSKKLIENNNISEAITLLINNNNQSNNSLYDELIMLNNSWNVLSKDRRINTITYEIWRIESNKIVNALIEIVNKI